MTVCVYIQKGKSPVKLNIRNNLSWSSLISNVLVSYNLASDWLCTSLFLQVFLFRKDITAFCKYIASYDRCMYMHACSSLNKIPYIWGINLC